MSGRATVSTIPQFKKSSVTCATVSSSVGSSSSATGAWSLIRTSIQSQKISMDSRRDQAAAQRPARRLARCRRRHEVDRLSRRHQYPERKTDPPRTRAQEVPSGDLDLRVIVIDSDERRGYEQAKREQAMERARQRLEKLKERIAAGDLKRPEK